MIKNKNRLLWLDFDNVNYEDSVGFLNITVTNDNEGGDSECTTITFDTGGFGGAPMTVASDKGGDPNDNHLFDTGKVSVTLWGGIEANDFFAAMKNLIHSYELRQTLGE